MRHLPFRFSGLAVLLVLPFVGCIAQAPGPEQTGTATTDMSVCGPTTVKGVDISHYDGAINWATVKAGGIDFAFAKATESTNFTDPTFATNWAGMKRSEERRVGKECRSRRSP